ncbi:hypothetical protein ASZ90_007251 [hydrocarbon metagenome]|uniref:Uncharacterized protein n=1 Tax=hydrocarbon metagenome TaxID=938273 RepID=A0A0W8FQ15_9ZZZZ
MSIIKKAALYFARKEFCRNAINEHADLSVIRKKHTLPAIIGLVLIVFSYVSFIPAFFIVGLIAAKLKKPIIGIIGIPLAYGVSWLIFMLGIYLTGSDYAKALGKCLVRIVLEKILGDEAKKVASNPNS